MISNGDVHIVFTNVVFNLNKETWVAKQSVHPNLSLVCCLNQVECLILGVHVEAKLTNTMHQVFKCL